MKARGLTVALAFVLAAVATLTVYLYVQGLEDKKTEANTVAVVVSKADIVAGAEFDDLLDEDGFTTIELSEDSLVAGAVTDLSQLKGKETSVPILAGEQISTARFAGSEDLPGGTLGIPKGHQALSLPLESPRMAAGAIQSGDRVRIMATFNRGVEEPVTVILVPQVSVLEASGQEPSETNPRAEKVVTLALTAKDAQKVVFAQEEGLVYLSLLPPDEEGTKSSPVGLTQVIK